MRSHSHPPLLPLLLHPAAVKPFPLLQTTRRLASALLLSISIFLSVSIFLSLSPSFSSPLLSFYGGCNSTTATVEFPIDSVSVLFPDWEVLVIVSRQDTQLLPPLDSIQSGEEEFVCVYPDYATSPARFAGSLPSTDQLVFKCSLPENLRRMKKLKSPVLVRKSSEELSGFSSFGPEKSLLRWTFLAYESFSTENDVVLFAKGVNSKQAVNRPPHELRCVFSNTDDDDDSVLTTTTAVTSSDQEVFRCGHPDLTVFGRATRVKISLEISSGGEATVAIPSVAYYAPGRRRVEIPRRKLEICAATMVYNSAKFLREWVVYHSGIGVDKFFLYDNDSDDRLQSVVGSLNLEGYQIEIVPWIWPKTQEAGFSHAAVYAKESCDWMMYVDVDEFVFSPRWSSAAEPSNRMLKSLISASSNGSSERMGQVSIRCNEFGPSGRESNPEEGVMLGYDCRRRLENRHKSIVLLEAIDDSLQNAVHHFRLRGGGEYGWKQVSLATAVVNHYKYQAWSEFRLKFRRRVSAYVVDWKTAVNMGSKDRAPGLGVAAVKPQDWERRFCEVKDERLKDVARRWFAGGEDRLVASQR